MAYLVGGRKCSERKACRVARVSRSVVKYVVRKRKEEEALVRRIHELAIRNRRYGHWQITRLLRREGWQVNKKRVHRLWRRRALEKKG